LGVICIDGLDGIVRASHARAANYFARSAALGDLHGANNVIAQRMFFGESVSEASVLGAFDLLTKACAEERNALGCYLVGVVFEFGIGEGESGIGRDLLRSAAFYTVAARKDASLIPYSAKALARVLLSGPSDIDIDPRAVVVVVKQLADQGDGEACWYLAHLTHNGIGTAADEAAAREYLESACEAGVDEACVDGDGAFPEYRAPKQLARPGWSTAYPESSP